MHISVSKPLDSYQGAITTLIPLPENIFSNKHFSLLKSPRIEVFEGVSLFVSRGLKEKRFGWENKNLKT